MAVALVAGALFLHNRKAHALTETDTVVLADFANSTGNPVFDDTLKQALAISLRQSPFLKILSDQQVKATLGLMTQPPNTPLTPEIAGEVCQRAGSKAYIAGSVASIGNEYVVGLKAVNCQSGDTLALEQVHADGKEKVLDALGSAATKLRSELGESLSSVQKFDVPIEQATTSSLEALKTYSLGSKIWNEQGETPAIPFFSKAIELDPNFAMAYCRLGEIYNILGEGTKASEYLTKAYPLRDRVTEAEKYRISTQYYFAVTGEMEKAKQLCELWAQSYPRESEAHLNLGFIYSVFGNYEKANAETLEAIQLDPDSSIGYSNLIQGYAAVNQLDKAKAMYQETVRRKIDNGSPHIYMYGVAFLERDREEMERQAKWAADKPGVADWLLSYQSDTEAFFGRLAKARELTQHAVLYARQNDQKETRGGVADERSAARGGVRQHGPRSRTDHGSVGVGPGCRVRRRPWRLRAAAIQPAHRKWQTSRKRRLRSTPSWSTTGCRPFVRPSKSIATIPRRLSSFLEAATPIEMGAETEMEWGCLLYPVYLRGQAYLLLHQGAEAATEFRKFIDHPTLVGNNPLFVLAHLGMARALALQGQRDKSRAAYQEFFKIWKDADPDIPILPTSEGRVRETVARVLGWCRLCEGQTPHAGENRARRGQPHRYRFEMFLVYNPHACRDSKENAL